MVSLIKALQERQDTNTLIKEIEQGNASVNEQDSRGFPVLLYAIEWRKEDFADYLVEKGATLTAATFYVSALTWNEKYVKKHLESGLDSDLAFHGYTPLMCAMATLDRNKRSDLAKLEAIVGILLENGADVNAQNKELEQTPLHFAAHHGAYQLVNSLLQNKADISIKDKKGFTALHHTCIGGSKNAYVVQQLVSANADLNAVDNSGCTPLHLAVLYYRYDEAVVLKHLGANLNQGTTQPYHFKNKKPYFDVIFPVGTTPYQMASYLKMHEIADVLY